MKSENKKKSFTVRGILPTLVEDYFEALCADHGSESAFVRYCVLEEIRRKFPFVTKRFEKAREKKGR